MNTQSVPKKIDQTGLDTCPIKKTTIFCISSYTEKYVVSLLYLLTLVARLVKIYFFGHSLTHVTPHKIVQL
jgi:hypothetical protein